MSLRRRLFALLVLAGLLPGCGYSIGTRGNLPAHVKTVAVPVFVNKTQEPAIENIITPAVVNAFSSSGRLTVVPVEQADSILQGTITGYRLDLIAFTAQANVTMYRLYVTLDISFRDVRQDAMLWKQDGLQEQADFQVQGQVSDTIAQQDQAARVAAVEIGRKIVASAVDRF
jgi:hypothetical protein